MSIYLENAKRILGKIEGNTPKIEEAKKLLNSGFSTSKKTAALGFSTIKNIIILLTPFLVYYKVSQVINLLKELQKDVKGNTSTNKWI